GLVLGDVVELRTPTGGLAGLLLARGRGGTALRLRAPTGLPAGPGGRGRRGLLLPAGGGPLPDDTTAQPDEGASDGEQPEHGSPSGQRTEGGDEQDHRQQRGGGDKGQATGPAGDLARPEQGPLRSRLPDLVDRGGRSSTRRTRRARRL